MSKNDLGTVLFICPKASGHLIKTSKIARYYNNLGYQINYFIQGNKNHILCNQQYHYTYLKSKIFGNHFLAKKQSNKFQKWFLEYRERKFKNCFNDRKNEIEFLLHECSPRLIFIDVFCISDFLFCYEYAQKNSVKIIGISPFFPEVKKSSVPPLKTFRFPGEESFLAWKKLEKLENKIKLKKKFLFPNRTNEDLIRRAMKKLNIPKKHTPIYWNRFPLFQNIDFWHLQPEEMDFSTQKLPNFYKYMGPMTDTILYDEENHKLDFFYSLKQKKENSKLIFCSLGTVILQNLSIEKVIEFFNKIIQIGKNNPNWYFAIHVPLKVYKHLSPKSLNVMIFNFIPYQKVLSLSDLFITHGGGNSYLEAIYGKTPMLVFPPISSWDYNGNAARIVFKNLGLKSTIENIITEIEDQIKELLSNPLYVKEISEYQELFLEKYHENYLDSIEMPLTTRNK